MIAANPGASAAWRAASDDCSASSAADVGTVGIIRTAITGYGGVTMLACLPNHVATFNATDWTVAVKAKFVHWLIFMSWRVNPAARPVFHALQKDCNDAENWLAVADALEEVGDGRAASCRNVAEWIRLKARAYFEIM